jgi:hypothetical protein
MEQVMVAILLVALIPATVVSMLQLSLSRVCNYSNILRDLSSVLEWTVVLEMYQLTANNGVQN